MMMYHALSGMGAGGQGLGMWLGPQQIIMIVLHSGRVHANGTAAVKRYIVATSYIYVVYIYI